MHPDVSCPSEQSFDSIIRNIERFGTQYNKTLQEVDRATGGLGAPKIDTKLARTIIRDTILNLSRGFADGKPVHGLNDNTVFFRLKFYDELFARPPLICIVRNPVDRAISTWKHNHRRAREKKETAARHLRLLENPEGTLEGYIKLQVTRFQKIADQFCDYAEGRTNILTVRYESLVEDKKNELRRLFSFLNVDSSPAVLESIAGLSTRERMAAQSTNPAFYGLGEDGVAIREPSSEFRTELLRLCSRQLQRLGYSAV